MKLFKLVPVAFRQYHENDDNGGWYIAEISTETKHYNPKTDEVEFQFGGSETLEIYLSRGWSIVSIQTAPIPACDSVPGAMISQYLLSIDVPDGNVPQA
ncbi:MAG: hypothetical protein IJQ31_04360 [Thermoguttaceae bacterium]|nr:hypothetical protein [Thermoguttaceae bacterium]